MKLDLSSFNKAIVSLKEAIDKYNESRNNLFVRDSVIQRFEYTYSLALKMIRRYFEVNGIESIDAYSFNDMIRTANESSLLLTDLEKWNDYRLKRNITSHTYDTKKAEEVVSVVDDFYKDAEFLYGELEKRNNG